MSDPGLYSKNPEKMIGNPIIYPELRKAVIKRNKISGNEKRGLETR